MYKVYLIKNSNENQYKIGYTRRAVEQRLKEFKTGNCDDLQIISIYESEWGTKIESTLHKRYKRKKINGEWFELDKEDVVNFIDECQKIHQNLNLLNESNSYIIEKGFK